MKKLIIICVLSIAGFFNSFCIAGDFPNLSFSRGKIEYQPGYSFQKHHIGAVVNNDDTVTELTSIMLLIANDSINQFRADSAAVINPDADTVYAEGADIAQEVFADYSTAGTDVKNAEYKMLYSDIQGNTLVLMGVYFSSVNGNPVGLEYFNGMNVETYYNNNPVLHFVDLSRTDIYNSPVDSALTTEKVIFSGADGCLLKDISYNSKSIGLLYVNAIDKKEYKVFFK